MRGTSLVVALGAGWLRLSAVEHARGAEGPTADGLTKGHFEAGDAENRRLETDDAESASLADLESLIAPLPPQKRIFTHSYRAGQITTQVEAADEFDPSASRAGLPQEKLIYSNTGGNRLFSFDVPNRRYADDVQTDALSNCDLSRYAVRVNGGVPHGTGEFSCKTALFTACPSVSGGGVLIPGTDATFTGLTDDNTDVHDLVVDVSLSPIPIPVNLWVRVDCSTGTAGWVGGVPAELGISQYFFLHPAVGCFSFLGSVFYSGFYVQLWAASDPLAPCQTHNVVYSTSPALTHLAGGSFMNIEYSDDFLSVLAPSMDSCVLSAYEVAVHSRAGQFGLYTEILDPQTGLGIPGTAATYTSLGNGGGQFEFARQIIEPGLEILLSHLPLRVTWETNQNLTSPVLGKGPVLGTTDAFISSECINQCPTPTPQADGMLYLKVYCRDESPKGS